MAAEPPIHIEVVPGTEGPGDGAPRSYPVLAAEGLIDRLPQLLTAHAPAYRYAVIADETVARLYGAAVVTSIRKADLRAELFSFPAGEAHKTRESWSGLSDAMLERGLGRDTAVVALGGGVTGDLAGFVAATYMRGVQLVQVPTTLLAMVDSSVGGKTGVDTPAGKNLVGAFLHPRLVVIDPTVLETLPIAHVRAGLAEAVKHGAIADAEHLDWIGGDPRPLLDLDPGALTSLVTRSVAIKASVVGRDERETGLRKILNFGHTIGHAIEHRTGYRILHGEAVAIGMVAEAAIGEAMGITEAGTADRLAAILERVGLPTRLPEGIDADRILAATRLDKKAVSGHVEYALLERVGSAVFGVSVPDGVARACLEDLLA